MRFELPKFCCVCLGPATGTWPVESSREDESSNGRTGWNPHLQEAFIRLNLRDDANGLEVPVCQSCRSRAESAARQRWFGRYFVLFSVTSATILAERCFDSTLAAIVAAALVAIIARFIVRLFLRDSEFRPAEWSELHVSKAAARQLGWKLHDGHLQVPTRRGNIDASDIPVFQNREYQRQFDSANGIEIPYGIPFGPDIGKSLHGFGLKHLDS